MSEKLLNTTLTAFKQKKLYFDRITNDFTQGKLTETAFHNFLESVQKATEKRQNMTVSSPSLSKPYDVFCFIN
jgi:hypothetical protein